MDSHSVEAYVPIEPQRVGLSTLIVHVRQDLPRLIRAIPPLSSSVGQPLTVLPMTTSREKGLDVQAKIVTVIATIGLIATLLAAAGMFAMIAFAVAQRTRELGIRMAIGARSHHVLWTLLEHNIAPIVLGLTSGTILGMIVGRIIKSSIEIIDDPLDPLGFAVGLAGFLLVAALATLAPALKALRIDPSSTLRYE